MKTALDITPDDLEQIRSLLDGTTVKLAVDPGELAVFGLSAPGEALLDAASQVLPPEVVQEMRERMESAPVLLVCERHSFPGVYATQDNAEELRELTARFRATVPDWPEETTMNQEAGELCDRYFALTGRAITDIGRPAPALYVELR